MLPTMQAETCSNGVQSQPRSKYSLVFHGVDAHETLADTGIKHKLKLDLATHGRECC